MTHCPEKNRKQTTPFSLFYLCYFSRLIVRTRYMKKLLLIALGAAMLSGCTTRLTDMTVASTHNYNLNGEKFVQGSRVTGEDTVSVMLLPIGLPNVKTAIDRAIAKNRCAVALSDVVISQLNHAFIFGHFGYRVEGTAIIDQGQPGCENAQ